MIKVYLAQIEPVLGDKAKNIEKVHCFIEKAALYKADLVLFPELALTGLSTNERTEELAESIDGPSITKLQSWANNYNIKVICGFPEVKDGQFFNAACFINNNGEIIGVHRKAHLWGEEGNYFSAGDQFDVWETDIGKIGIMICFDTQFPESARTLALKGAEMIFVPTGNMSPFESLQPFNIQSRAEENQLFIATTNLLGTEGSLYFFGESMAADPFGEIMVKAGRSEEGVLVEIDLERMKEARKVYSYLENRRPDLYGELIKNKKS